MEDSKVAVLLEDIKAQFRVFGEGLQMSNEKVDNIELKVDKLDNKMESLEMEMQKGFRENNTEHQLIMQMIKELSDEQLKLKKAR